MVESDRPAVERRHPPDALMKVVNPVMRRLVARGRAAEQLVVLHYTGRRTGRRYDVPAGYHVVDGVPTVFTNSGWRHNFAGAPQIEVSYRGRLRPTRAELVTDVDTVTDVYVRLIEQLGWQRAQRRLGLRITVGRTPTREEVAAAVTQSGLSLVRLPGLVDAGA